MAPTISKRNLNYQEYRNIRIQRDESDDDTELLPLISYDSDDDFDNPFAWKHTNTHAPDHTSVGYAQLPDTLHHIIDERPTECKETVVIDTSLGPHINYYSRKALEVAQAVKTIQGKLGKFSLRKVHEAILNGSVIVPETFTRAQILTADEILGTDVEYKQGIYTEKTQSQNSEKTDPTSRHCPGDGSDI